MAHRKFRRSASAGLLALAVAGCVSAPDGQAPAVERPRPQPVQQAPISGDLLLGRNAASLISLFGQPALDVREGPGRKLQFSGTICVLDLYLYPPQRGGEPVSAHADARLPDGRDADRAVCAASLRRR